ncbi:hypothetical protein PENTCL1PPCAC_19148, partial [Pristionchus entomophagus]
MAQIRAPLAIVEEWWRKSNEYFYQSNDGIHSLHMKGFDAMVLLLSKSIDHNQIRRAMAVFDSEGRVSMQYEKSNAAPVRHVSYGFMESTHLTFLHLINKIDTLQSIIDGKIPKSHVDQNIQTDFVECNAMPINIGEMLNENL